MSDLINQEKHHHKKKLFRILGSSLLTILVLCSAITLASVGYLLWFDSAYKSKILPNVYVGTTSVGGQTPEAVQKVWEEKNSVYRRAVFEFKLDNQIATVSGEQLQLGYDSQLIARQAFLVGRSGNMVSDVFTKLIKDRAIITPYFRWEEEALRSSISFLAQSVDTPAKDARFSFVDGKVTEFQPAEPGKRVNIERAEQQFNAILKQIPLSASRYFPIQLSVETVQPSIATEDSNTYGIREKIGSGYSEFVGSIPGRIHNVGLAASKFNGVLIKPGEVFSFNAIVGDISAATGYQSAYIIKDGRTVLGDGGGVCQVSTTMFRAALSAGLPIIDWTPHAYRVQYYEQANFKPGLDATIFVPSVDFKFKNDLAHHILIQTITDKNNKTLTINFFGTADGRKAEILNHQIFSQTPPPAPLYQDDPGLAPGVVKQVDWAAWGAKTAFTYKVTRGSEILTERSFQANFRPWQAVYLRGPQI